MNRNSNISDSRLGDCEELINICSENGVLRIVKDKQAISVNIPYNEVIIHDISGDRNYIGKDANGWVWFDPETGIEHKRLYDKTDDVYLATLNNMLIISDRTTVKELVYNYNDGAYALLYDGLDFEVSTTYRQEFTKSRHVKDLYATSQDEYIAAMQSYVNKFKVENKEYCEGLLLYAFSITLNDGIETGMFNLTSIETQRTQPQSDIGAFIELEAYIVKPTAEGKPIKTTFKFNNFFQKIKLIIDRNSYALGKYKDKILKVNLYVSRPISKFRFDKDDIDFIEKGPWEASSPVAFSTAFNPVLIKDSGIEKELLYKQKSWSLDEFCNGLEYTFEFGGDIQTTGATMEVSSPSVERAGKMFTYNNRVHFYNSRLRINAQLGDMYNKNSTGKVLTDVYVFLRTPNKDIVLKYKDVEIGTITADSPTYAYKFYLPNMVIFPDSRAYRMMIIEKGTESIDGFDGVGLTIDLTSSPAYNYSYFFGGDAFDVKGDMIANAPDVSDIYEETNTINVSAAGNPMVFPVEHSYLFDGTIKNLAYATEPISQTQIGQYPLYVFTDKGIFAMEQGSGTVLYANQITINTDKCDGDVAQTRNGVIYTANGGIYVLSGRNTLNISLPISGPLDIDIRKSGAYAQCCLNDKLYNIAENLSQTELQDYIQDAKLVYIPYRDTLVVSNSNYKYSYVFSFIYKTWYKITETIGSVGHNVILQSTPLSGDETHNILVDYAKDKESSKVVHLQSRPMSFAQAYTIIRRLILHCKASITLPDNLSLYLFASNNLSDWHCVSASQKSDVTLDHIRLQRVARAYKYYIIIIGGQINTNTELSYIMMEIEERFESKIR